jgi:pimeloyl-ACP methyl ester carboxylesterase
LVYDSTITGDASLPSELAASVPMPTLVIDGGASWGFLRNAAEALAAVLPNGRRQTLPDQTHHIDPDATAAALSEFLSS